LRIGESKSIIPLAQQQQAVAQTPTKTSFYQAEAFQKRIRF
jgi:hypothetical protein